MQIVSKDMSDPVRSHKDLDKDAAPYFKKAVQFYEELAKQLVGQGHVLDLFASALDQVFNGPLEFITPTILACYFTWSICLCICNVFMMQYFFLLLPFSK